MSSTGGARKRVAIKVDAKKASLTPKSDKVEKPILPDFNPLLPKYQFDENDQTIDFALSAKRVKHSEAYEPNSHSFAAETRRIGLLQALSLCANADKESRTVIIDMYGSIRTFNMLMLLSERSKKKYVYVLAYGQFTPKDGNRYTSGDLEFMLNKARSSRRVSVVLVELSPGSFYNHLTKIREKIYNLGLNCPRFMLLGDVYQVSSSSTETIPISHQHFTQALSILQCTKVIWCGLYLIEGYDFLKFGNSYAMFIEDEVLYFPYKHDHANFYKHQIPHSSIYKQYTNQAYYGAYAVITHTQFDKEYSLVEYEGYHNFSTIPGLEVGYASVSPSSNTINATDHLSMTRDSVSTLVALNNYRCFRDTAEEKYSKQFLELIKVYVDNKFEKRCHEKSEDTNKILLSQKLYNMFQLSLASCQTSRALVVIEYIKNHIDKIALLGTAIVGVISASIAIPLTMAKYASAGVKGAAIFSGLMSMIPAIPYSLTAVTSIFFDPAMEEFLREIIVDVLSPILGIGFSSFILYIIFCILDLLLSLNNPGSIPIKIITQTICSYFLYIENHMSTKNTRHLSAFRYIFHFLTNLSVLTPLPISIILYTILCIFAIVLFYTLDSLRTGKWLNRKIRSIIEKIYAHNLDLGDTLDDMFENWETFADESGDFTEIIKCDTFELSSHLTSMLSNLIEAILEKNPEPTVKTQKIMIPVSALIWPTTEKFREACAKIDSLVAIVAFSTEVRDFLYANQNFLNNTSAVLLGKTSFVIRLIECEEDFLETLLQLTSEIQLVQSSVLEFSAQVSETLCFEKKCSYFREEREEFEDENYDDEEVPQTKDLDAERKLLSEAKPLPAEPLELDPVQHYACQKISGLFRDNDYVPKTPKIEEEIDYDTSVLYQNFQKTNFCFKVSEAWRYLARALLPVTILQPHPIYSHTNVTHTFTQQFPVPIPFVGIVEYEFNPIPILNLFMHHEYTRLEAYYWFGFSAPKRIVAQLINRFHNLDDIQQKWVFSKMLGTKPKYAIETHSLGTRFTNPKCAPEVRDFYLIYRVLAPTPFFKQKYQYLTEFWQNNGSLPHRLQLIQAIKEPSTYELDTFHTVNKHFRRRMKVCSDLLIEEMTKINFIEHNKHDFESLLTLYEYFMEKDLPLTTKTLYKVSLEKMMLTVDKNAPIVESLEEQCFEKHPAHTKLLMKANELLTKEFFPLTLATKFATPEDYADQKQPQAKRPEVPRAVFACSKQIVADMKPFSDLIKTVFTATYEYCANIYTLTSTNHKKKPLDCIYDIASGLTNNQIALRYTQVRDYHLQHDHRKKVPFYVHIATSGDDAVGSVWKSAKFIGAICPDVSKFDASQDFEVIKIQIQFMAKLAARIYNLDAIRLERILLYCYTRPLAFSQLKDDKEVLFLKRVMRLSGAADTSMSNSLIMLLIMLCAVEIAYETTINMKYTSCEDPEEQYGNFYNPEAFLLAWLSALTHINKYVFKMTNLKIVKNLEQMTFLRCYFTEIEGKIQMCATPGMFIKALSKIHEPYKYVMDIRSPLHIQAFRKTVLSSLLALPHHSSFDELLLTFKEQPELDLVLKNKVAEDIEASFKEKFAVTWGTVSTVIDYQNVYAKRYNLETSEVQRLLTYLAAPSIIHQDLARISYKILSVDYC